MLTCSKCGAENPLGRVFCGGCGAKLDLEGMSSAAVADVVKVNWFIRHWTKFLILLIVIPLVAFGFSLWPQSGLLGEAGTMGGANRVSGALNRMKRHKRGKLTKSVKAKDINAFFEYQKLKSMKLASCSVLLDDGYFHMRMVKTLGELDLQWFTWEPSISFDLFCVSAGGGVGVSKASIGHLPAGPFKGAVVKHVYKILSAEKEWAAFANLSEVKIEPQKITLVLKK